MPVALPCLGLKRIRSAPASKRRIFLGPLNVMVVTRFDLFFSFRPDAFAAASPAAMSRKVGDVEDILVAYDGKESKLCKGLVDR